MLSNSPAIHVCYDRFKATQIKQPFMKNIHQELTVMGDVGDMGKFMKIHEIFDFLGNH